MRKLILIGTGIIVLVAVVASGAIFAQDDPDEADTTEPRAWLGITIVDDDEGVVITSVMAGSPANAADLLIGDVIVSFDGEAVTSASELSEMVQAVTPGDTVTVEVLRFDETISIDVRVGRAPQFQTPARGGQFEFALPGMGRMMNLSLLAELLLRVDLEETNDGYEVVEVLDDFNPFELQEGDIITAVNGVDVAELDIQSLSEVLQDMDDPQISITILRDGEEMTLEGELMGRFEFDFGGRDGFGRGRGFRFPFPFPDDFPNVPFGEPEATEVPNAALPGTDQA